MKGMTMHDEAQPPHALRAADLDDALAHWTLAPLPADFVARTMVRVRAQPRFRLSAVDALIAGVAALVVAGGYAAASGVLAAPTTLHRNAGTLAIDRFWLAIRPADPRVVWMVAAAFALSAMVVAAAAWIGRPAPRWTVAGR